MAFTEPSVVSQTTPASTKSTLTPQLLTRIRGEFREMPGLRLTLQQARRLLNLDMPTCAAALAALRDAGFLRATCDGSFMLADGAIA